MEATNYRGSYSYDDPDRPIWDRTTVLECVYDYHHPDGCYASSKLKGRRADGQKVFLTGRRFVGSMSDLQIERQEWPFEFYRHQGLEHYRKGSGGEPDLPYRLPELNADMTARPDDPVFIPEGEKDVDSLRQLGLIATTNPNGALNWKSGFNAYFAGCDVILLPDNDERGRQRTNRISRELSGVARSVTVIELPGLPPGGDISDWLAGGKTKDDLLKLVEAARGKSRATALPLLDPAEWAGKEVPPRQYAIHGLFLASSLATLTGPGAAGKSLLGQQAATAVAVGVPFLGMRTEKGNAGYLTSEDDERELHERQVAICMSLKVDLTALSGKLWVGSLVEFGDKALVRASRDRLVETDLFDALRQAIIEHRWTLLMLDNAGHFYGGDENARAEVVAFLGKLNKLAHETGCAIVLISHPNKSGATYSGVTAWQNQVRAQVHLSKPDDEPDSNVRELRLEKANYAPPSEPIRMLWHRGAFTLESAVPTDDAARTTALQLRQNEIFYHCLSVVTARQQPVSAGKTAINYAPKVFARMREAQGMTAADFERTMDRLLDARMVESGRLDFKRPGSRNAADGIRRTGRREADNEPPL